VAKPTGELGRGSLNGIGRPYPPVVGGEALDGRPPTPGYAGLPGRLPRTRELKIRFCAKTGKSS
jgi:hypothetical protein